MRSKTSALIALAWIGLGAACSGKMAGETAFSPEGDLSWQTRVPSGDRATLWLAFDVNSPSKAGDDGPEPDYHFQGVLKVESKGKVLYQGPLYLSSQQYPLRDQSSRFEVGGSVSCNSMARRCSQKARVKLMDFEGVTPGAELSCEAKLEREQGTAEAKALSLQLWAK